MFEYRRSKLNESELDHDESSSKNADESKDVDELKQEITPPSSQTDQHTDDSTASKSVEVSVLKYLHRIVFNWGVILRCVTKFLVLF